MLESGLQRRLVSDPAVQSFIGTRCYPVVWPTDNPEFNPALLTFQLISTVTAGVFSGTISLTTCRVQFDSYAKNYGVTKALASAVTDCLQDFSGLLPDGTRVANITLDSSSDLYDSPTSTFRIQSDYLVQFYR